MADDDVEYVSSDEGESRAAASDIAATPDNAPSAPPVRRNIRQMRYEDDPDL